MGQTALKDFTFSFVMTWPDGTSQQFLYERNDLPWALTGLVDEAQQRTASYGYSAAGLAISTAKHGPGGAAVDAYNVNYPAASPGWTVTEDFSSPPVLWRDHTFVGAASLTLTSPTGAISVMSGSTLNGAPKLTGQSQPAGSGCAAATSSQAYDSNGIGLPQTTSTACGPASPTTPAGTWKRPAWKGWQRALLAH